MKHQFFQIISLGLAFVITNGCASTGGPSGAPKAIVQDVPFQARDNNNGMPRKRVMVLPFLNDTKNRSQRITDAAREAMVRSLRRSDDFVVIGNSDFPKDLNGFLKNNEYDLEQIGKLAGSMGLASVIEGKVLEVKAHKLGDEVGLLKSIRAQVEASVQLRVWATKNNKHIYSDVRVATIEDTTTRFGQRSLIGQLEEDPALVEAAVSKAVQSSIIRISQSLEKLSWEGRVALVKGDRIYLNAGRLSGLQVGDILKVTEEGEDVFDPESGALIGRVPGRMKGTVEVVSYFGRDGAIAVVHSGSGMGENDIVETY